jgi:Arm domain-containing DNA-binding protein
MAKRTVALTDEKINNLKPAAGRVAVYDPAMPGLAIRVQPTGHKTFVFGARYPAGNSQPGPFARRELGQVGHITLDEARAKAKVWAALIKRGIDPKVEEAQQRAAAATAAAQAASNTFGAVAEDFIREVVVGPDPTKPKQRKGNEVARAIRRVLIPIWGARLVTEIT